MRGWMELRCRESSGSPGLQWIWQAKIGNSVWALLARAGYRVARESGPGEYTGRCRVNGQSFQTSDEMTAKHAIVISLQRGREMRGQMLGA